jgi:hypothetical protein
MQTVLMILFANSIAIDDGTALALLCYVEILYAQAARRAEEAKLQLLSIIIRSALGPSSRNSVKPSSLIPSATEGFASLATIVRLRAKIPVSQDQDHDCGSP